MSDFQPGDRVAALDYVTLKPGLHGTVVERNEISPQFFFILFDGYKEPWGYHGNWLVLEQTLS